MESEKQEPIEIECLACGRRRLAPGTSRDEIGVCPVCGYVGWSYADKHDRGGREKTRRSVGSPGSQTRPERPGRS